MSAYKVVRDAQGRCVGCGPNDDDYDPTVPPGGRLDLSDVWVNVDPTADEQRLASIDDNIKATTLGTIQPASIASLKAMTLAEYSAWFDANFGTAALLIGLLKRLTLVVIRRVL